jgi:hypothetical protein
LASSEEELYDDSMHQTQKSHRTRKQIDHNGVRRRINDDANPKKAVNDDDDDDEADVIDRELESNAREQASQESEAWIITCVFDAWTDLCGSFVSVDISLRK